MKYKLHFGGVFGLSLVAMLLVARYTSAADISGVVVGSSSKEDSRFPFYAKEVIANNAGLQSVRNLVVRSRDVRHDHLSLTADEFTANADGAIAGGNVVLHVEGYLFTTDRAVITFEADGREVISIETAKVSGRN